MRDCEPKSASIACLESLPDHSTYRAGIGLLPKRFDEFGEGLGAEVAFAAMADGDGAGFGFLGADDEHVGNLLHLRVADFCGQLFVAVVEMDAKIVALQSFGDVPGVIGDFFADRADFHLHGREPQREGARVMLDQDAEKALDGAEQRAVDHQGLMLGAVFADVLQAEARGEIEIELHGGELPRASDGVDELDVIGRPWQLTTVQFDFNLPARFGLQYVGEDGAKHQPLMVHRALLGSVERFFGILIEHYAGAFPLWLAPVQVEICPVSEKVADYARHVTETLKRHNLRVHLDDRNEKLPAKIRDAQLQKIPYMLVVGPKEAEAGTVSVRHRSKGDLGPRPIADAVASLQQEIANRTIL